MKNQKKEILSIFGIFIISRLAIFLIGYFSTFVVTKAQFYTEPESLLHLFFKWDSNWYISIIENGYSYVPGEYSNVAFFPLYPLLVKIFSFNIFDPIIIGYLISNIALFLAVVYFYKLVYLETEDHKLSFKSIFYLLIFPTSFFFSIIYTEGLFLFLSISCFYYIRKKQWLTASILGFFLAQTRIVGVLILIPMIIEYFDFKSWRIDIKKVKEIKADIFYFALVPLGLISYMVYLYYKFGDALVFLRAQSAWGRSLVIPFSPLLKEWSIIYKLFAIFALFIILYLIYTKFRISYTTYSFAHLTIYLSTSSLHSIPRLVGVIFPIYIAMSLITNKNKWLYCLFIIISIIWLAYFTVLFVNGYLII